MIKKNNNIYSLYCSDKLHLRNQSLMKHPLDNSQSRTIVLDNGLKVYLLSDPDFNVSAASISVDVGSFQDPDNRLGLAHFFEHMLFLGTEKYPDVDEYSSYLKNNGGFSNAYTSTRSYKLPVSSIARCFRWCFDRFAQFLLDLYLLKSILQEK